MAAHHRLILFLGEFRKSLRNLLLSIAALTLIIFLLSPRLLQVMQQQLAGKLYFFSVAGPFLAHVKLAVAAALFLVMPWLIFIFWRAAGKPFAISRRFLLALVSSTAVLFYGGALFCYWVTLPLGIQFLLGFASVELQPVIAIEKFVHFVVLFMLAFALVFELPVAMVFLGKTAVCSRAFFQRSRRYALLLIAILAAMLTPTPDVVNMLLMGGPLYMLYEAGIVAMRVLRIG